MPHTIRTERLLLRPVTIRDARAASLALNDWAVLRETGTWGYPADADACRRRFALTRAWDPEDDRVFAVVLNGTMIGTIGLHRRVGRAYEIGYMIGRAWWGKGYVTEAVRAVCAFGFRVSRADRFVANVFVDNPGSARVLRKAGFRDVGDVGPGWSATRLADFPRIGFELRREGWTS